MSKRWRMVLGALLTASLLWTVQSAETRWKNEPREFGDAAGGGKLGRTSLGSVRDGEEGSLNERAEERMRRLRGEAEEKSKETGERDTGGKDEDDKQTPAESLAERAEKRLERLRGADDKAGSDKAEQGGDSSDEQGERKADVKEKDRRRGRDVEKAERQNSEEARAIERLRASGRDAASLNRLDGQGVSLLHHAVLSDWPEMTAYLLEAGADPRVKDRLGRTPGELADKLGRKQIARLLRD